MRYKKKRNYKNDRVYSAEFREKAIQLALHSPSLEMVAKEIGIPEQSVGHWLFLIV